MLLVANNTRCNLWVFFFLLVFLWNHLSHVSIQSWLPHLFADFLDNMFLNHPSTFVLHVYSHLFCECVIILLDLDWNTPILGSWIFTEGTGHREVWHQAGPEGRSVRWKWWGWWEAGKMLQQVNCTFQYMGVSKNRGIPKWMVYNGKPYENWWFGGTLIFGNTHMATWWYIFML